MRKPNALRAAASRIAGVVYDRFPARGMPAAELKERLATGRALPTIELSRMGGYRIVKFGPGHDNPLQEACAVYLRTGDEQAVWDYLAGEIRSYRPASLAAALFGSDDPSLYPLTERSPLDKFEPWNSIVRRMSGYLGQGESTFATLSEERLRHEARRLTGAVDSLRQFGYRPEAFPQGFISGSFLFAGADYRFIVKNGMHRLAAMAALGTSEVVVRSSSREPAIIDAADVDQWAQVRSGYCSRELALRLVGRYFE